jgi:outer membrane lipoprotein SlyB
VPTPLPTPDRLSAQGTGIFDEQDVGLPDWECGGADDWDPPEPTDWDLAELADWEPEDPEAEPPDLAMLEPEASASEAERHKPAGAERGNTESLKAGPWDQPRGNGGWFVSGGVADDLFPGPRLAGFIADAKAIGLGRLTDDELIGMMRAARRLASWSAAMELAAAGDLWRRRWIEERAGATGAACHADDEIAAALTLTGRAADQVLSLAVALRRLPLTSQALTAGTIDLPRAMVIADEVTGLGYEHAAAVEQAIIGAAAGQTTGQLRAATRRAVLAADPGAARKRKEQALQDARVERWDEHGGTAALAGRDLPPASVLAADKNLSALARQLQRAGAPGTLDQLRAQVYLALLTGASVGSLIPTGPGSDPGTSPGDPPQGFPGLAGDSPVSTTSPGLGPLAKPSAFGNLGVPTGGVNLTMPLASWLGLSDAPGDVAGFGPLDANDSRAIADVLSARSGTRWCLTLTDSRGRPVAHGGARAGPPPSQRCVEWSTGPPGAQGSGSRAGPAGAPHDTPAGAPHDRPAGSAYGASADSARDGPRTGAAREPKARAPGEPKARAPGKTWTFTLTLLAGSDCDHASETAAYRPSAGLRHLIEIRHATCTYPGCRRPAARCDADHTVAYHRGGRTCLCNLAPLCRRHHAAKQTSGWYLEQASPGVMTWTTPAGRRYAVGPSDYPG